MILSPLLRWTQRTSLVTQIVIALLAGIALAVLLPAATPQVAPILQGGAAPATPAPGARQAPAKESPSFSDFLLNI